MFNKCNLHELYIQGFPALIESFYIQEKLVEIHLPKVANHMVRIHSISPMFWDESLTILCVVEKP